jgi:hypothetical protein
MIRGVSRSGLLGLTSTSCMPVLCPASPPRAETTTRARHNALAECGQKHKAALSGTE